MTQLPSDSGGVEWLRSASGAGDVVLSSRVRLARNVAGFRFLSRADTTMRQQLTELLRQRIMSAGLAPHMLWVDLASAPPLDRNLLMERHLISKQHAKSGALPRGVAVSNPDERLSIMVNEEDHLRIQVMRSGLALGEAYRQIDEVDDKLEAGVEYAYHERFGYLTACPTNVGAGIRVSVMLHMPGLMLTGEIDKVRRAAKGMNLAIRGFYGEGSEAVGDLFQISNQTTLGKTEQSVLEDFQSRIVPQVIEYERRARATLLQQRKTVLEDKVYRALGTLLHARLLNADEAMQLLSHVRLGVQLGQLEGVKLSAVHELLLLIQPAHLQRVVGRPLDQAERRIARANLVRAKLGG